MSFEVFKDKVNALIKRSEAIIRVGFYEDKEYGRFFACCSDGVTIIGKPTSKKVTVKFGSEHQAMAVL